ncbi:MAG TPA: helix-turn-helix domain-containing protein [Roseiflexaceae bacterium]|nr:helix-turn-helix domain-containing protein [Roseiflexaceae bacterium]
MNPKRIQRLLDEVASAFDLAVADLLDRRRDTQAVQARQIAMYVLQRRGRLPLVDIGRALGRNHSTISHGIAAVEARIARDPELAGIVRRLLVDAPVAPAEPPRPAESPQARWWWVAASYGPRVGQLLARAA